MRSMTQEWSEKQLIDRCSKRPADETAWQEFVRRFHPTIRSTVSTVFTRLTGEETVAAPDSDDAIDASVQRVYRRLTEKDGTSLKQARSLSSDSMKNYLMLISINAVREQLGLLVDQDTRKKVYAPSLTSAFGLRLSKLRH